MIISGKPVVFSSYSDKSSNEQGDVIIQCPMIVALITRTVTSFGIKFSSTSRKPYMSMTISIMIFEFSLLFLRHETLESVSQTRLKLFSSSRVQLDKKKMCNGGGGEIIFSRKL